MSALGGLNKTPNGVVISVVQLQLPSEDEVVHTDGTSCRFERPTRRYGDNKLGEAAE